MNFLTVNKLSTERHFIVWAAKLHQHIYFKSILTSKFESKDMLLWKRGFVFVPWFDGTRPLQKVFVNPKDSLPNKQQEAVWRKQCPNSQNGCL